MDIRRWLDLCCCEGGASTGYRQAGLSVSGVDIVDQPRYPFTFYKANALKFIRERKAWIRETFVGVSASPPCQKYSKTQVLQGNEHPDLIAPMRDALGDLGLPYVIENVEDALSELKNPIMLCGAMEPFGLNTYRHRLFEVSGFTVVPPEHPKHVRRQTKMGRPRLAGEMGHYVGNFSGVDDARIDMGMRWASRDGIREAVPPVFTKYIGEAFLAQMTS